MCSPMSKQKKLIVTFLGIAFVLFYFFRIWEVNQKWPNPVEHVYMMEQQINSYGIDYQF